MPTKKTTEPKKPSQGTLQQKITSLEEEIKTLKQETIEKNDKYLRTLADFQNYQKRNEKNLISCEEEQKKKYLTELLEFQELLQKAILDSDPKKGLTLILSNLDKFLEKEKIKPIESKGKPFDHTVHFAVSTIESDTCEDGTVVEEIKKGYMIGDKLLRPCQVIVAKKKQEKK
jgi:molecular chaperone GrpE